MARIERSTPKFKSFSLYIETEEEAAILWAALNTALTTLVNSVADFPYMMAMIRSQEKKDSNTDQHYNLWQIVDDEIKHQNIKR